MLVCMEPVKAVSLDDGIIEGLAIPYGGPMDGVDLTGTAFHADTDFALDWFPAGRPVTYQHGLDSAIGLRVVGRQVDTWADDAGRWARAQLDKSIQYWAQIRELVEQGKLFFSSGSMSHLVEYDDAKIKTWPWVELALTPEPANPYAIIDAGEATKRFHAVGLHLPTRALPTKPDALTLAVDFGGMDKIEELVGKALGSKPDPIRDLWLKHKSIEFGLGEF